MKEFNEYLDTAKTAFDKVAPGLLNPYFPAVVNLKNKINECWKVFTEIVTTKEPRPIRHPDNQIELMGSRSANPKAVVDYAQHIVGQPNAAAKFLRANKKILPDPVTYAAPAPARGGRGSKAAPASPPAPAPARGGRGSKAHPPTPVAPPRPAVTPAPAIGLDPLAAAAREAGGGKGGERHA